jgi:hypothetical protein
MAVPGLDPEGPEDLDGSGKDVHYVHKRVRRMHEDMVGRGLFGEIVLDQQMPADTLDIDHAEGPAFAKGAGRAIGPGACLVLPVRHLGEPLREIDAIRRVIDHCSR